MTEINPVNDTETITPDNAPHTEVKYIIVKDLKTYGSIKATLDGDTFTTQGGILHEHSIHFLKDLVFNMTRLNEESYVNGLVHAPRPVGTVTLAFDEAGQKRIILTLVHKQYDQCKYSFRIGNRGADIPLTEDFETIYQYIGQFILMDIPQSTTDEG